jgi:hypothetical protein
MKLLMAFVKTRILASFFLGISAFNPQDIIEMDKKKGLNKLWKRKSVS